MKLNTNYKSRFRILKGGKISLVVSALLVSISLSTPVNALTVNTDVTTTQSDDPNFNDIVVTPSGSVTITADGTDFAALYGTADIYTGQSVSNSGTISVTNTNQANTIKGIFIDGYSDGDISNLGSGTIIINSTSTTSSGAIGIDLDDNSGDITLNGGDISVTSVSDATGVLIGGNHTGTITNSALLSTTVNTSDFNDNAVGIKITGNMTSASIENSGTIDSNGNKNQTYGIYVNGTVTDSTITNSYNIYVDGTDTSEAYGIFLKGGTAGTTTITNTSNGTITATSLDSEATAIHITGNSVLNEILNEGLIDVTASSLGHGIFVDGDLDGDITNSGTIQVVQGTADYDNLYGIKIAGTLTGTIDTTFMDVSASQSTASGILVDIVAAGSTIKNSATIKSHSTDSEAYGIFTESNDGTIETRSLLDVSSDNDISYGIYVENTNAGTITNSGTIKSESIGDNATGMYIGYNTGSIVSSNKIEVNSTDGRARGINVYDGDWQNPGTITNSGTIIVDSINDEAIGIKSAVDEITNQGEITAYKNEILDKDAFSIKSSSVAHLENTYSGTLNGNIYMYGGTLTNAGTISLPHNAGGGDPWNGVGDGSSAFAYDFINEASATLTIGLQTNGTTTTHSQLAVGNATFENGTTINVDITSASTNVGNIAGERLNDVVTAMTSLTIDGTINITDNSALLNFELIDDANSLQDNTIDLAVVQGQTVEEAVSDYSTETSSGGGQTPAKEAARVLDRLNDGNHPAMNSVFSALNELPTNEAVASAVESTTPQNTGASVGAASQISGGITGIVEQRQNVTMSGGLNSGDEMFTNKNVWFKPFGSIGKQNDKDGLNGFDLKAYGVGIGVDGEINPNQTLGFAFFYTNASVDVNNVSQKSNLDVFTTLVYGNMPVIDKKTRFMYQLGYAFQKTSGERDVFTGDTATSDYTSKTASLDLKLARNIKLNDKLTLQPMLEGTYRHFTSPSYSESGAGALNLDVEKFTSSELVVGGGAIVYYKLDDDSKLVGNINVGYDLHDRQQSVTASYQGASGVSYDTNGIDNGRWSYDLGIGYEKDIDELSNINISFNRTGEGSDFSNNTVSAKYVLKF